MKTLRDKLDLLARNLLWTWHPEVASIFQSLDPGLWRRLNHNPIAFLAGIGEEELERRAKSHVLDSRINYAVRRLEEYLQQRHTWAARHAGLLHPHPVGYFSAEFDA